MLENSGSPEKFPWRTAVLQTSVLDNTRPPDEYVRMLENGRSPHKFLGENGRSPGTGVVLARLAEGRAALARML